MPPEPAETQRTGELRLLARWRGGYRRIVADTPNDLPRVRVLLAFPAVLLLLGIILVALTINGSSSGAFYSELHTGKDPALLAGAPEKIRSDEWNVGVPWTINQIQQGFPARNYTFPGGMDPEIPFALPQTQASVAFEPQLWGFLALPLGSGMAWKWWLPGLTLIAAAYVFLVTLVPRRPGVAAVLAVGFFFSPFIQWWYESSVMWPIAWATITMAAILWSIKSPTRWARWVWVVPVAYATATMAFGIYAPFIVPVVFVVLFFAIGLSVEQYRAGRAPLSLAFRFLPVISAGIVGIAVTAAWLHSKASTVSAFVDTVYPGQRLTATGTGSVVAVLRTIGSSFAQSLQFGAGFLGANSSEASSFFLAGAFLLPVTAWACWRARRSDVVLPWVQIALFAMLALFLAFMFVPGWNAIAHLLFLDRSTSDRLRIGVGLASFALVGVIIRDLDALPTRVPRQVASVASALFLFSQLAIAAAVQYTLGPAKLWGVAPLWLPIAVVSAVALYWVARRMAGVAAFALLVVGVVTCGLVNPVYVGVLDLRTTAASRAVIATTAQRPGAWVGVGGSLATAILLESGVREYDGTQGAPSRAMWKQIDPDSKYTSEWNRLGSIQWTPKPGPPSITNPAPDVILVTYDACASFSQNHVAHVLGEGAVLKSPCLRKVETFETPHSALSIYDVVR